MVRAPALVLLVSSACVRAGPPPVVALPIESLADNRIVVPATVNGRPMRFLLDTGAATTLIRPAAAIRLGYPAVDRDGYTISAGGRADAVAPVVLENVTISERWYPRVDAYVAPFHPDALDPSLDGVLGQDFLALHDVEIDFVGETLRLLPPGTAPRSADEARLAVRDASGLIRVDGALDGRSVAVVLDLGATGSIVNRRGAPERGPGRPAVVIGSDGTPFPVTPHAFSSLVLGDATFAMPTLYVGDLPMFDWLRLDDTATVLIGVDLLAGRRVVIDYRNRELRIGPVAGYAVAD